MLLLSTFMQIYEMILLLQRVSSAKHRPLHPFVTPILSGYTTSRHLFQSPMTLWPIWLWTTWRGGHWQTIFIALLLSTNSHRRTRWFIFLLLLLGQLIMLTNME